MRYGSRVGLWVSLLALAGAAWGQAPLSGPVRQKLDAALLALSDRAVRGAEVELGVVAGQAQGGEVLVSCLARIAAPGVVEQIAGVGGVVGSLHGDIATVRVPLSRLGALAHLAGVLYLEASYRLYPHLDAALPEAAVDVVQGYTVPPDNDHACDGGGVIIGLTDSGLDFSHPDFLRDPDGDNETRVLWLWDQTNNTGTPPSGRGFSAGWSYGSLWDNTELDGGTCSHQDTLGHGTHVAGIAAGDGSGTGNGQPAGTYVGCAPGADLVMVRNTADQFSNYGGYYGSSGDTLDAYDFIRTVAAGLSRPHVINTSQGTNLGPHDGTTLFEQALNADVAAGSVIVLSAGNAATEKKHYTGVVPGGGQLNVNLNYTWDTPDGSLFPGPVDVWYQGADRVYLSIRDADGQWNGPYDPDVQTTQTFDSEGHDCTVTSTLNCSINGDNRWLIYVDQDDWNERTWILRFTPKGALPAGGRVHLWAERDYILYFPDAAASDDYTLAMPACAQDAITVGAHQTKLAWTDVDGSEHSVSGTVDQIASYSSHGPLREGSFQKPELTAPGHYVASTASSYALHDNAYVTPDGMHVLYAGTSMSAPMVTGTIALMLQKNAWTGEGTVTPAQIKQALLDHCAADAYTGTVPNDTWGYGKLRADAAWNAVPLDAGVQGFTAVAEKRAVRLSWELSDEIDCGGFNLYRAAGLFGAWVKINEKPVLRAGVRYQFTDTTVPLAVGSFLYRLESVDSAGRASLRASTLLDFGRSDAGRREAGQLEELIAQ